MTAPTPPSEPQGLSVLCFSLRSVEGSPDRTPLIQRLRGVGWDRQLVRDGDRHDVGQQKSSGVKPFVQITQGLKPYMGQQVSSFQGRFAEWRLRRLGAT